MEPEGSLPHSQVRATCVYPEPARSSPYPLIAHPCSTNFISFTMCYSVFSTNCICHTVCVSLVNFSVLGYYAARGGNSLPTFQDNLSVPSLMVKNPRKILVRWQLPLQISLSMRMCMSFAVQSLFGMAVVPINIK